MATWAALDSSGYEVALEVLLHGPLTRTQLADRIGFSPASLTRLTKPLLDAGLLVETETVPAGRLGRPSQPLDVVPDTHHFVGMKLTDDAVHAVLTDLRADVLSSRSAPVVSHEVERVVRTVVEIVDELAAQVPHITALGVSIGGHAEERSTVTRAPFLHWRDVRLAELIGRASGAPTVVENDLIALTEAERWFGAGRRHETFALLTIGAGVGLGLVAHGKQVTSPDAGLGLIGHHVLDDAGPRCPEGHRGCATAMLTTGGITGAASAALRRWVDHDEVLALAVAGSTPARTAVDDAGRALGRMIATVANFTFAQAVVLGGEGVALAEVAADAVSDGLTAARDGEAEPVRVLRRRGTFTEWARGAAVVAIQSFVSGSLPSSEPQRN